jgi:hypothetical protein
MYGGKMDIKAFKPWLTMWIKPKETIKNIIAENPNKHLLLLSTLYGFVSLLGTAQTLSLGEKLSLPIILIACLIIAPIWGFLVFSFASGVLFLTGKWIKGIAHFKEIRTATAWSSVPMVVNLFLWIILLIIFQNDLLKNFPKGYAFSNSQLNILFIVFLIQLILSVWSLIIYVNVISQVQNFSIGKSILNLVVSFIIIAAVFFIIGSLLFAFFGPQNNELVQGVL